MGLKLWHRAMVWHVFWSGWLMLGKTWNNKIQTSGIHLADLWQICNLCLDYLSGPFVQERNLLQCQISNEILKTFNLHFHNTEDLSNEQNTDCDTLIISLMDYCGLQSKVQKTVYIWVEIQQLVFECKLY